MGGLFLVSHWALVWSTAFLPFLIRGQPWDGAPHTAVQNEQDYQGLSPVATEPPTIPGRDLLPRQNGGQICGFGNADISRPSRPSCPQATLYTHKTNSSCVGSAIQCPVGSQ